MPRIPTPSVLALFVLLHLSLTLPLTRAQTDPCANYGSSCDSCVGTSGCGWCSWKGTCVSGDRDGPSSSVCFEPNPTSKNWYYGTCTDECYLVCDITCTNAQDCFINRDVEGPPQCSCQTKAGIIIGAVVGSISCFCLMLTIFVCIRRRNAMKQSRALSARLGLDGGLSREVMLPRGQPVSVIAYGYPVQPYQPPSSQPQLQ